jgi:hypothetical protein
VRDAKGKTDSEGHSGLEACTIGSDIEQKTNLETGRISWTEIQPHFARGAMILIDSDLDLVKIASAFIRDDREWIATLLGGNRVRKPNMLDAERWFTVDMEFWAVVVAPWILVQETSSP